MSESKVRELKENEERRITSNGFVSTNYLKILSPHHIVSSDVTKLKHAKCHINELLKAVDQEYTGMYKQAYSLAHCEISETPLAFFVVNQILIKNKTFKHQVFINPKIVKIEKKTVIKHGPEERDQVLDNSMEVKEACMMFPHRKPKKLTRPYEIKVEYQTPVFFGLIMKRVKVTFDGLQAQIFQHNLEHIEGKNIFFEN